MVTAVLGVNIDCYLEEIPLSRSSFRNWGFMTA